MESVATKLWNSKYKMKENKNKPASECGFSAELVLAVDQQLIAMAISDESAKLKSFCERWNFLNVNYGWRYSVH